MKVWVVEIYEYGVESSETTVDSIWTDEGKARERVEALKKMEKIIPDVSHDYYYYGIETDKEDAEHKNPDEGDD